MDTTELAPPAPSGNDDPDQVGGFATDATDAAVMHMLHDHVPLSLLADLAALRGPSSREILDSEGLPTEPWWRPRRAT